MTGWPETIETPQSPRNAPSQEHGVLLGERQIETEPLPQRLDRLAARLVAEDELRRIAGDDPHQHEDQRQHREQRDAGKAPAGGSGSAVTGSRSAEQAAAASWRRSHSPIVALIW